MRNQPACSIPNFVLTNMAELSVIEQGQPPQEGSHERLGVCAMYLISQHPKLHMRLALSFMGMNRLKLTFNPTI